MNCSGRESYGREFLGKSAPKSCAHIFENRLNVKNWKNIKVT